MLLLVTDTSGRNGTVALARAENDEVHLLEVVPLAGGMFSAQLVPQIASLLQNHGFTKSHVDAFIVVSGPGSFTGLRVGLAAIKALAEILQKPIVPVSLLELVATDQPRPRQSGRCAGWRPPRSFLRSVRTRGRSRSRFCVRNCSRKRTSYRAARDSTVATPDSALAAIATEVDLPVLTIEPPNSEMIARFGWKKLQAGKTVSPERLEANYMRRSDAEMFVKQSS